MSDYRCRWCSHTTLKRAEVCWYEVPLLVMLLRPFYCPHCFVRFYRPPTEFGAVSKIAFGWLGSASLLSWLTVRLLSSTAIVLGFVLIGGIALAFPWLSTNTVLATMLLGATLFLAGMINLTQSRGLRRLKRIESRISGLERRLDEVRELLEELASGAPASHPVERDRNDDFSEVSSE